MATETASGCKSSSVTTAVNLPPPFTVTPLMVAQQTSCDVAAPNGSVTAAVGGVTAGFTFNWFKGQSTAPADAIAGPTGLAAGTYTVVATNNATGCTASDFTTVTPNLIYPVVTLTPTANSICNPALASQYIQWISCCNNNLQWCCRWCSCKLSVCLASRFSDNGSCNRRSNNSDNKST